MIEHIIINLHRGTSIIGRLIRWQSRSVYSHASMILPGGVFIESREGVGVHCRFLADGDPVPAAKGETVDQFVIPTTPQQAQQMEAFAKAQVGKKYDYTMVARFVSRRGASRRHSDKWFCSELVYAAAQKAGIKLLRATEPWEVSPGLLSKSPKLIPLSK